MCLDSLQTAPLAVTDAARTNVAPSPLMTAELTMRADTNTRLELQEASSMVKMLEMLEDLDDVQNVYSNADIPDDVLAQL